MGGRDDQLTIILDKYIRIALEFVEGRELIAQLIGI